MGKGSNEVIDKGKVGTYAFLQVSLVGGVEYAMSGLPQFTLFSRYLILNQTVWNNEQIVGCALTVYDKT